VKSARATRRRGARARRR